MNNLRLVIGKSGSGKNFLCNEYGWKSIPSYTTRGIRVGETNGDEHVFITDDIYNDVFKDEKLPAYSFFNGYHYFATKTQLEDKYYDVYIVDFKGLKDMLEYCKRNLVNRNISVVLVKACLIKRIIRMYIRGDKTIDIIKRIIHDIKAFKGVEKYIQMSCFFPHEIINN